MNEQQPEKLVAARPEAVADRNYGPGFPYKWVVAGLLLLGGVTAAYMARERQKAATLRDGILQVHDDQLAEASARYGDFRDRLDAWIVEAAAEDPPEQLFDPRLKLAGLRSGDGLYLRIPAEAARRKTTIAAAAGEMVGDAITTCLGLAPASARGLYEKGEFLLPSWVEEARTTDDVMTLRVKDHVLSRAIRADLPGVLGLLKSDWFMLVLERGPDRRSHPVDVFLWDIRSGRRLLAARVKARGFLLPARIVSKGAGAAPPLPNERLRGGGAIDCSIASQLREVAGFRAAEVNAAAAAFAPTDGGLPDSEHADGGMP